MIKLVIFDLGETLIFYKDLSLDWSTHYENAVKTAADKSSLQLSNSQLYEASKILLKYNTRINPRINEIPAEVIFNDICSSINISKNFLIPFIESFFNYFQRKSRPEETACELLSFLKIKNLSTAVLTDVPYGMPKYLVMKDLESLAVKIDFVLTSSEVGFRKPSPEGVHLLLSKLNCSTNETIMVGNEKKDIEAANEAGVFSILISKEKSIHNFGQSKTIHKLYEIKELLNAGTNILR